MFTKLAEATRLLCTNLGLFSAIILTVWLPGNVLANYLAFYVYTDDEVSRMMRFTNIFEGIFGDCSINGAPFFQNLAVNYHPDKDCFRSDINEPAR